MRFPRSVFINLFISTLVVGLTAALSYWWQQSYWVDLNPPLCSSRLLLAGDNPYEACYTLYADQPAAAYPMTTLVAFLPFTLLPGNYLAPAFIWGSFNGLLVFGLLRNGTYWKFLIFLSAPYWICFTYHQFSVLITAVALLPSLLPLALLKPQNGLPVILTNLTWRRLAGMAIFLLISFILYPNWLTVWYFSSAKNYDGIIPLLLFPLSLFLLAGVFWLREPRVRFLLLMACMPQRALYDIVPLYLLPRTLRQMLLVCFIGWIGFAALIWIGGNVAPQKQVQLSLVFNYLPILFILILRSRYTIKDNIDQMKHWKANPGSFFAALVSEGLGKD
jgi:hypothetical protein